MTFLGLGHLPVGEFYAIGSGLSADGTVLVGSGLDPQGDLQAWIATLPALPVAAFPELDKG